MTIHRKNFFLLVLGLIVLPVVAVKVHWLLGTRVTKGIMAFRGHGEAGDQVVLDYSCIYFRHGKDTIWFDGLGNLGLGDGSPVSVRYHEDDPYDAKVNIFIGIWGDTLVYGGVPVLMLLVVFLHPQVVPRRARVRLSANMPYIQIMGP